MSRKQNINITIRKARVRLGFTQEELSSSCNMTESEYRDIEDYDDELYMVVPINKVVCVCNLLEISLQDLYGFSSLNKVLPRDIISIKTQEKNYTVSELSDIVGIEESYIDAIMKDVGGIGDWVMDPIMTLSTKLGLDLGAILESYFEYYRKESQKEKGKGHSRQAKGESR